MPIQMLQRHEDRAQPQHELRKQQGQDGETQRVMQSEQARLKREVARLEEEVAFLKKAAAYFAKQPK